MSSVNPLRRNADFQRFLLFFDLCQKLNLQRDVYFCGEFESLQIFYF